MKVFLLQRLLSNRGVEKNRIFFYKGKAFRFPPIIKNILFHTLYLSNSYSLYVHYKIILYKIWLIIEDKRGYIIVYKDSYKMWL